MRDLAPTIHRQRLVVEGRSPRAISADDIKSYLTELSEVLGMTTLLEPVTHRSDTYGWAGWIHWETSGAHFYAWEEPDFFFSVDIYTCKEFDALTATSFTAHYFDAVEIEFGEWPAVRANSFVRQKAIEELSDLLLDTCRRADFETTDYGIYLVDGESVFADLARYVELEVFFEVFQNDDDLMAAEYDPYDPGSTFVLVMDHKNRMPAAASRILRNSPAGLKSLRDFETHPDWGASVEDIAAFHGLELDLDRIADVATAAIRSEYRGGTAVSAALYHGAYWYTLEQDFDYWVGVGDTAVIELWWSLGMPCTRVCDLPAVSYLDSPASWPIIVDMQHFRKLVRSQPELPISQIMRGGGGLLDAVSLPDLMLSSSERQSAADLELID